MNRCQGEKTLVELFESSGWKEKYKDQSPPNDDGVLYKWSSAEAEYAMPFFSKTGQSIMTEETCISKRSLFLNRDESKNLTLYVFETEKESYRQGIPDMAREFACMMKVDKLL
ncbi:hypothetical protein [Desulfonatronovibrio magnus]|uniref:hypothetical protein n=1 Tax=Desulfonatronovibrio magnus TaxID=698827 RepID=UPI0005EADA7E|nr:hypothetical protein [Desulfonatronovibrio magnus]